MKALILAGGLGTRLQEVVPDRPKTMAKVKGKPFLEYLVGQLHSQGFEELVLCVGHLAEHIEAYFGDGSRWGVRIQYAVENTPLGTAGAIRNASHLVEGAFLVLNGDTYLEADFRQLLAAHRRCRAADPDLLGTIATLRVEDAAAFGTLEFDGQNRILRFREKVTAQAGRINGGVYVLEPAFLDLIPPGQPVSIERDTFPLLLERGYNLRAYRVKGFFVDIGTPEGYRRFQRYVEEKEL